MHSVISKYYNYFFLIVIIFYNIFPKKIRPYVLLLSSLLFFYLLSGWRVLFLLLTIITIYLSTFKMNKIDEKKDNELSNCNSDDKKIIKEKEVDKLVLGLPKNMNGTIGERGEYILKFKELLQNELGYDVVLEDERLTTKVAENILINADLSRKKRKKVIDKMAATVILQGYLDRL